MSDCGRSRGCTGLARDRGSDPVILGAGLWRYEAWLVRAGRAARKRPLWLVPRFGPHAAGLGRSMMVCTGRRMRAI